MRVSCYAGMNLVECGSEDQKRDLLPRVTDAATWPMRIGIISLPTRAEMPSAGAAFAMGSIEMKIAAASTPLTSLADLHFTRGLFFRNNGEANCSCPEEN